AHYDHLGRGWPEARAGAAGEIHNGADDNASGIAVLIEVAAALAAKPRFPRSIVFAAFDGEEWERRGSRRFVRSAGERDGGAPARAAATGVEGAIVMVNLDCVGRLGGRPLTILGAASATEWTHIARGIQHTTGVASQCIEADPGGSDQVSFQEIGVPAIQLFSGMHEDYHRPTDDAAKVDAEGLVKVAIFLREAVEYLAAREEPLTPPGGTGAARTAEAPKAPRRVSLGTVPDFAYGGPGVRAAEIVAGSPADSAGMRAGDILLAIDGKEIADLKALAEELRARAAGERVRLRVLRAGDEIALEATLVAR
ncbi:MAG: M20/M25/M40 family metallo-hydrolase, partial [Planctomycetes bacterium]|nr:M20/M25/M40 family metallo-hydrolase [Planctomycetota bacterium]